MYTIQHSHFKDTISQIELSKIYNRIKLLELKYNLK